MESCSHVEKPSSSEYRGAHMLVSARSAHVLLKRSFWPRSVYARPWKFKDTSTSVPPQDSLSGNNSSSRPGSFDRQHLELDAEESPRSRSQPSLNSSSITSSFGSTHPSSFVNKPDCSNEQPSDASQQSSSDDDEPADLPSSQLAECLNEPVRHPSCPGAENGCPGNDQAATLAASVIAESSKQQQQQPLTGGTQEHSTATDSSIKRGANARVVVTRSSIAKPSNG